MSDNLKPARDATPWPMVKIGDITTIIKRSEEPLPGVKYRQIGVRLWGQGAYERETLDGINTKYKELYRAEANDIIINKIWARNGSVAVVSSNLAGCYGSSEFPMYTPDINLLEPQWFHWITKTAFFWQQCNEKSYGTSGKNRIRPERFLEIEIPLPPLDEQRRIVARIEALAAKVEAARELKKHTTHETSHLWKMLSSIARNTESPIRTLDEIVEFCDGRRVPLSEADRNNRKGPYPYYGASGIIDYIDDYIFDEDLLLLSEDGANLILRSKPIAFIARGKYWVNNHAHVLRPNPELVDIKFLEYVLSDYNVSEFNFASAQAKLNQKNARKIAFPLPSLPEQHRIVAHLDALQAKIAAVQRHQAATQARLDALMPSILDRAFHGEL